jgi:hypothetical protein
MAYKKPRVQQGMIVVVETESPQGARAFNVFGPGEKISQQDLDKGVKIPRNENHEFVIGPRGKYHTVRVTYKTGAVITEVVD